MLDLSAPIEPGKAAAGLRIGQRLDEVLQVVSPQRRETLPPVERVDFGSVQVWARDGLIDQIGVRQGYLGSLGGKIRIGSSIRDVEAALGPVVEDLEDNLIVPDSPGWCFETETWLRGEAVEDNPDARITEVFVFSADERSSHQAWEQSSDRT